MLLLAVKLVLVSDVPVHIRFSPFDDSLYVTRAYAFLTGDAWGAYDPYTLAKLPGISLWLIANRLLGVPYLLGINVLYGFAGLFLLRGAAKAGAGRGLLLFAYAIYLANPVTFSVGWALVMREALSSVLIVALLGVSLHLLVHDSRHLPRPHLLFLTLLFSFTLILREEDTLLWSYLFLLALGVGWLRRNRRTGFDRRAATVIFLLPALIAFASQYGLRQYNLAHYDAAMLTDYSEGELPKLIASIRSVESATDNRLVMIPQDVLAKLRPLLPEFAPVIDALPPPGRLTYSCMQGGVCSEWNSGYMIWWIKQAAAEAGLTPSLLAGQAYFRGVREHIDTLCTAGVLACRRRGDGMLPPMELRWVRAYTQELRAVMGLLLFPKVEIVPKDAQPVSGARGLVRTYQAVTMTSVTENPPRVEGDEASSLAGRFAEWRGMVAFVDGLLLIAGMTLATGAILWRWTMYPGVPVSPVFCLCLIFWAYSAVRIMSLAYVAVYFGPYEPRIIFSTYTGLTILSVLAIWECRKSGQQFRSGNSC